MKKGRAKLGAIAPDELDDLIGHVGGEMAEPAPTMTYELVVVPGSAPQVQGQRPSLSAEVADLLGAMEPDDRVDHAVYGAFDDTDIEIDGYDPTGGALAEMGVGAAGPLVEPVGGAAGAPRPKWMTNARKSWPPVIVGKLSAAQVFLAYASLGRGRSIPTVREILVERFGADLVPSLPCINHWSSFYRWRDRLTAIDRLREREENGLLVELTARDLWDASTAYKNLARDSLTRVHNFVEKFTPGSLKDAVELHQVAVKSLSVAEQLAQMARGGAPAGAVIGEGGALDEDLVSMERRVMAELEDTFHVLSGT